MTKSIRASVQQYIIKHGRVGKAQLCEAVNKSERTLDRWLNNGFPSAHDAFKLALACGLKEREALRLAREESLPEVAKETA